MLTSSGSYDQYLVWAIFGIIAVVFGAYYATFLVAKKANSMQQGRAVRVLDRFAMGKDKLFCLLSMGDVVYLVGMADGAITVIDRVTGERAEALRNACEQNFKGEFIRRGAGFVGDLLSRRRFNSELDAARRKLEQEENPDAEQLMLKFAREEDDIDAVLRKIDTRKKSRENPDGGENE